LVAQNCLTQHSVTSFGRLPREGGN